MVNLSRLDFAERGVKDSGYGCPCPDSTSPRFVSTDAKYGHQRDVFSIADLKLSDPKRVISFILEWTSGYRDDWNIHRIYAEGTPQFIGEVNPVR